MYCRETGSGGVHPSPGGELCVSDDARPAFLCGVSAILYLDVMAAKRNQESSSSRTRFALVITLVAIVLPLIFFSGALGSLKINLSLFTNPDLEDGLVGHWTFDGKDMVENVADRSGQGNNGFLQNFSSTTTRPGRIGQGLLFDGIDDHLSIGDIGNAQSIAF